jgi:hypothetical protein
VRAQCWFASLANYQQCRGRKSGQLPMELSGRAVKMAPGGNSLASTDTACLSGVAAGWQSPRMALQHGLGLLPQRRLRSAPCRAFDLGRHGRHIAALKRAPLAGDARRSRRSGALRLRVSELRGILQVGGAGRNRTAGKGFADLRLTTWRPRRHSTSDEENPTPQL